MLLRSALIILLLSGCASMSDGSRQMVKFNTFKGDREVKGVCHALNAQNDLKVETPGFLGIKRSYDPLTVSCVSGKLSGEKVIDSDTNGRALGNVLAGGVIGAVVDMSTGAAYQYPDQVTVEMR